LSDKAWGWKKLNSVNPYITVNPYIFLDEGRVFDSWRDDFSWRGWEYSYGGGIRVWNEDKGVILNFSVAHSAEETRFNLAFGESF